MMKTGAVALAMTVLGVVSAGGARADEWDKKTVLTFSQPVEVAGHVLPAGTYTFKLADSMSDRHIVQIFNADGSQILATVMAIPDYPAHGDRPDRHQVPRSATWFPGAIRAWFYPGNTIGQAFVYPKPRATQLAKAAKAVVPAMTVDIADLNALKTAPIMAITPDEKEVPVAAAIQTTPVEPVANVATVPHHSSSVAGTSGVTQRAQNAQHARHLPKTASALPLIVLLGLGCIGVAFGLAMFGKQDASGA